MPYKHESAYVMGFTITVMALKRINIGFTPALLKALDKYAAEHGLDRTNAVRFCVSLVIEEDARRKRENSIA